MGRNFEELRARMTPESRARAQEETDRMVRVIKRRNRFRIFTMLCILFYMVSVGGRRLANGRK